MCIRDRASTVGTKPKCKKSKSVKSVSFDKPNQIIEVDQDDSISNSQCGLAAVKAFWMDVDRKAASKPVEVARTQPRTAVSAPAVSNVSSLDLKEDPSKKFWGGPQNQNDPSGSLGGTQDEAQDGLDLGNALCHPCSNMWEHDFRCTPTFCNIANCAKTVAVSDDEDAASIHTVQIESISGQNLSLGTVNEPRAPATSCSAMDLSLIHISEPTRPY